MREWPFFVCGMSSDAAFRSMCSHRNDKISPRLKPVSTASKMTGRTSRLRHACAAAMSLSSSPFLSLRLPLAWVEDESHFAQWVFS